MVTTIHRNEEADELAGLIREADELQADADQASTAPGAAPGQPAPPGMTNAQCLTMALQIVRETLCSVVKVQSPRTTLDDAACSAVGEAVAPVLDKHGINLGNMAGDYMAELRALAVTVPIALAVRTALLEELAARRAKPIKPEPAAPAAPAADDGEPAPE